MPITSASGIAWKAGNCTARPKPAPIIPSPTLGTERSLTSARRIRWCLQRSLVFSDLQTIQRKGLCEPYFGGVVGVGAGADGGFADGTGTAAFGGAAGAGVPLTIDPGPRCPMIASASAPA